MSSDLLNRAAILMLVLCGLPGCTPSAEPETVEVAPQKSPEQIARELEKIRQDGFQTRYDGISRAISSNPDRFDDWIGHLEDLVYASEGTKVEIKAKNLLNQQLQYREDEGKKSLDLLTARVESLIAEGDPLAAERILEEFDPDGTYVKTAAHQGWNDLREQVAIRQRAEIDFDADRPKDHEPPKRSGRCPEFPRRHDLCHPECAVTNRGRDPSAPRPRRSEDCQGTGSHLGLHPR